MVPMTRRGRAAAAFPNDLLNPQAIVPHVSREESWQVEGVSWLSFLSYMRHSDFSQDDSRSERELSENPSGSFQDYDGEFDYDSLSKP